MLLRKLSFWLGEEDINKSYTYWAVLHLYTEAYADTLQRMQFHIFLLKVFLYIFVLHIKSVKGKVEKINSYLPMPKQFRYLKYILLSIL